MSEFAAVDLIKTKRDGGALTDAQIKWFVDAYTRGEIADEQASAFLMAVVWRGMTPAELTAWTAAMIESGTRLDLSSVARPTVDKHSTGGVGDKVSLILAPMIAACGAADPMLSGRGLGHTGGTLDKLEAIPGFEVDLGRRRMLEVLQEVGCVICAAGEDLAPADRKLYALRDVTGTVESIPLIASSIMSKKIAEGTSALVLDVKVGSGAFLPDIDQARELARTMVRLGRAHNVETTALLTRMDVPLGKTIGNAVEVEETLEVLRGGGPADLIEVTLELAREMLRLVGIEEDAAATLQDGRALAAFEAMVRAQGGDLEAPLPQTSERRLVEAHAGGVIEEMDARKVGIAAWRLGAGRARKEDPVDHAAGIVCLKKPGHIVEGGEPILELRTNAVDRFDSALEALRGAIEIGDGGRAPEPAVIERITT
ncbi:MAG: thymidine phosphorylase [Actinomycetota bacterium]|nr:thymidine phosphorylase [Actinomycetota bacterium]